MAGPLDGKEQVRRAIDIVELVGDYLPLRREGRAYKGLCPWHDDSRPSLHVNPERQSFKCWVCDIGGDIFSFVMKMENVEFPEALQMLAERAGVVLPRQGGPQVADEKQALYQAMAWAESEYHHCLVRSAEAEPARRYLIERGITADSVQRFHLGYAPERWDWLLERSRSTPHKPQVLEKLGLVVQRQNGSGVYDRFRGRVLFSIRDPQRRPVGLGGRILPGSNQPDAAKYINSPETPLFSKSSLLYGLDMGRDAISRSRSVLVMEGYTDVIVAHQHGFQQAVAVLGTALGERHLPVLRRFADQVVLVLDGDEAGQRRTNEVLGLFVADQLDLRILVLPEGLDPCDFLLARGAAAFQQEIDEAVDALEHKFRTATAGADDGMHQAQRATEEILRTLALAPRLPSSTLGAMRVKEDQILNRLAHRFGIAERSLRARLRELRGGPKPRTAGVKAPQPRQAEPPLPARERLLLEYLVYAPECLAEVRQQVGPEQLQSAAARIMFMKCCDLADDGLEPSFERLMLEFDDPALKKLLVEVDDEARAKHQGQPTTGWRELLLSFQGRAWEERSRRELAEAERFDEAGRLEIWNRIIEQKRSRQGVQLPKDG